MRDVWSGLGFFDWGGTTNISILVGKFPVPAILLLGLMFNNERVSNVFEWERRYGNREEGRGKMAVVEEGEREKEGGGGGDSGWAWLYGKVINRGTSADRMMFSDFLSCLVW